MQGILRFDLQIVFLDIGHSVFWRAKLFFQISLELSWMVGEAFVRVNHTSVRPKLYLQKNQHCIFQKTTFIFGSLVLQCDTSQ